MALTVRYFSTSAAGAGDGTTWANRAALFSSGNWSSVITGFDFSANALECRIGPGTYTCSQTLNNTTITTDPTIGNFLLLHGCDSSGNRLDPPDPDWTSDLPTWDTSGFPTIATTGNTGTINQAFVQMRCLVLTASGTTGVFVVEACAAIDWCHIQGSSTASLIGGNVARTISNSVLEYTGTTYNTCYTQAGNEQATNVRVKGNSAASSGNRVGVSLSAGAGTTANLERCTIVNFQVGVLHGAAETNFVTRLSRCVVANNASNGIEGRNTGSQIRVFYITGCVITGNGGYGIDARQSNIYVSNCRLRDNTSGDFFDFDNYATDIYNYTTDDADADDFVDATAGNYQIKSTAGFAGRNIGVSQQASGGGIFNPFKALVE
jgi:hypothetical protein